MSFDPDNPYVEQCAMYGARVHAIQVALGTFDTGSNCDGVQWLREKLKKELKESNRSLSVAKKLRNQVEAGTLDVVGNK